MKLGPGGLQSWAGDVIAVLREAPGRRRARARGSTALDADLLDKLRERYDEAVAFGIIHNRLRDWHEGNHPGYALGCWLRDYKEQVFLFTRDFAVDWTTNVAERGAKAAKRHQAVSGYWHTLATLARWCRIRSYLDSAAAHGITALDAIRAGLAGKPWLPPLPAAADQFTAPREWTQRIPPCGVPDSDSSPVPEFGEDPGFQERFHQAADTLAPTLTSACLSTPYARFSSKQASMSASRIQWERRRPEDSWWIWRSRPAIRASGGTDTSTA